MATLEDLEKTQELTVDPSITENERDTVDLNPKPEPELEHDTQEIDVNPVRKRLDSSQWITSW